MKPYLSSLLIACCLLLGSVAATTYRELSLDELVQHAEIAVYGTIANVEVVEEDGEPWTRVSLEPTDVLLGEGESFDFLFYGGTLPTGLTIQIDGMPVFSVGEEVILFAYDARYYSPIVGFSQGLWRLTPRGFEDAQGRVLSLDEEGTLLQDGPGAGTDDVLSALSELLEAQP